MAPIDDSAVAALAAHLDADCARLLASRLDKRILDADQPLVAPGWPTDTLYFVLAGGLDVELEEPTGAVRVGHIGPGTWVGEAAFIDGGPATATVLATSMTTVLALRRDDFDALIQTAPRAASSLLQALCVVLAGRIQASSAGQLAETDDGSLELTRPPSEPGPWRRLLARLTGASHG